MSSTPYTPTSTDEQQQLPPSSQQGDELDDAEGEESWTFVDDYADAELSSVPKRASTPAK
jgi:sterol 3beta-glucosyltransferase